MKTTKPVAAAVLIIAAASLLLSGCGPAQRQTAQGGEDSKRTVRTMEVAGLKLVVPEANVIWPTVYPKDPGQPKYGGTITFAREGDAPSIDPSTTTSVYRSILGAPTYDKLVTWNSELGRDPYDIEWVPALAESWEISKDGLSYSFNLRKGVEWPDVPPVNGREFTSDDVRFSYDYFTRPDILIKSAFAKVETLEAPDKYTAIYRLKQRDSAFINTIGGVYAGFIVPREVVQRDGDLRKVVIGTGPFYSPEGYQPKVGIDFKRNPNHWRKDGSGNQLPYMEGWKYRVMPDHSARIAAFRTGKLDIGFNFFQTPSEVNNFAKTNPNILFQEYQSPGVTVNAFRIDKAPWDDARVRRAMSLAINHDEMAQALSELPKASMLAPTIRGYWLGEKDDPQTLGEWYVYDPEKAKKLLSEAGYSNGFSTNYQFFEYTKADVARSEMLKSYWAAVGVDVELKSMDYTVFRSNTDRAGWDEMIRTISFPTYDDVDNVLNYVYHGGLGNLNQGGVNDPEINRWVEAFWSSDNTAERADLIQRIRRKWLDQVYTVPLYSAPNWNVWHPWVRNFQLVNNAWNSVMFDHAKAYVWIDDSWRK